MKEVGNPGVYLMDNPDVMPCIPKEISLDDAKGTFPDRARDKVALRILGACTRRKEWCGVEMSVLIRRKEHSMYGEQDISRLSPRAVSEMVQDGFLTIPGLKKGWRRPFNIFLRHIVCPTPMLAKRWLEHQMMVRSHNR